jgi:hypothetical protein
MTKSMLEQLSDTNFFSVLLGDIVAILEKENTNGPRERRSLIRATFAAVEGSLAELCEDLLTMAARGLTESQNMALRQESIRVEENGSIKVINVWQPLKTRVRLVTEIVKRLHPEHAINFGDRGWQQLIQGLDTRDRVTHPKNLTDLDVSDEDCNTALDGMNWFLLHVIHPGNKGIGVHLLAHLKALELAAGRSPWLTSLPRPVSLLDTIETPETKDPD